MMFKTISTILMLIILPLNSAHAGKILLIGDSHSTAPFAPFGSRMNELLRGLPKSEVSFYSRCGSIVNWWYQGIGGNCGFYDQEPTGPANSGMSLPAPNVVTKLDTIKPDLMIVELGANYMQFNDWTKEAKEDVAKLVKDISVRKIPCIWVGQPSRRMPSDAAQSATLLQKMRTMITGIRETVEPVCTYIDSTELTTYPATGGKDGIHYSFPEGIPVGHHWAESVFENFVKNRYQE